MKLTLSLPDDFYDRLVALAKARHVTVQTFLAEALVALDPLLDPTARAIVLDAPTRVALEAALHRSLRTPEELVRAVEGLARVKIGEIAFPLTAVQADEIRRKAEANGRSYEDYAALVIRQIAQEFLATV